MNKVNLGNTQNSIFHAHYYKFNMKRLPNGAQTRLRKMAREGGSQELPKQ